MKRTPRRRPASRPGPRPGRSAPAETRLTVTRRSLASVDLDGGRVQGLAPGDRLRVVEGPATVAELEVVQVAERSARCKVVSLKRPVRVGDVAVALEPAPEADVARRGRSADGDGASAGAARSRPRPAAEGSAPAAKAPAPAAKPPCPRRAHACPHRARRDLRVRLARVAAPPRRRRVRRRPAAPSFTVEYRSADSVYVDGGRAAGLEVGRSAPGARRRRPSWRSSRSSTPPSGRLRAGCSASRARSTRGTGPSWSARRHPPSSRLADGEPPVSESAPPAAPLGPRSRRPGSASDETPAVPWARAHGAASIGYYRSWDGSETDLDYQERTARVDLGVYDIAGQPLSFALRGRLREDVRARELSRRTPGEPPHRPDLRAGAALRPARTAASASSSAASGSRASWAIGYLDGALVRFLPRPGIQVGAFGGRQADITNLDGTGSEVRGLRPALPGGTLHQGRLRRPPRLRARERRGRGEPRVPQPREPLRGRQPVVAVPARGARHQPRLAAGGHREELPVLEHRPLRKPEGEPRRRGRSSPTTACATTGTTATAGSPRTCSTRSSARACGRA